jgi:hypothetical protein
MTKYFFLLVIVLAVLMGSIIWVKRKDIPFQEVVTLDKGIAVINAQKWFVDDLKVFCFLGNKQLGDWQYDAKGTVLFSGLQNGKEYTVKIIRTDLKGLLLYKPLVINITPHKGGDKYFILVGASIGKNWKFDKLPERLKLGENVVFGNRTVYQFDKTKIVEEIIDLPVFVSGVILKECSAYFPRDMESSKKDLLQWRTKLEAKGIKSIFATTVPVTVKRAREVSGKQKSLEKFNDFIRQYGEREGVLVLDLEKALRRSATDRHLRDDFAQKDGVHLVEEAYRKALDPKIPPLIWKAIKE